MRTVLDRWAPPHMLGLFALFLVVRGLPAMLLYRSVLQARQRAASGALPAYRRPRSTDTKKLFLGEVADLDLTGNVIIISRS